MAGDRTDGAVPAAAGTALRRVLVVTDSTASLPAGLAAEHLVVLGLGSGSTSALMPTPLSVTVISSRSVASTASSSMWPPSRVNLAAFWVR